MFCSHCGKQIPPSSKFCPVCGKSVALNNAGAVPSPDYSNSYGVSSTGIRFANFLLDRIFSFIFAVIVGVISNVIFQQNESIGGLLVFISFIGYYLLFEGIWQRSPAKWITKTKVVMNDGTKPDFLHILGRSLARFIPFEPFSFIAGPVGWHDSLSKTLVVPSNYGIDEVKKINPENVAKSKTSTPIIIAVCLFIGIAVIGLLSSVVLLALNSARAKARDAKRLADVRQVASALELYFNDKNSYPESLPKLETEYIGQVPTAPTPNDGSCSEQQNSYDYTYINSNAYYLTFCLGAVTGGYSAGVHYLTPQGIGDAKPTSETIPSNQPTDTGQDCPNVKNAFLASDNVCYCNEGYKISSDKTYCIQQ